MAWQYRPHDPASDAQHTLNDYQAGLRAAELRARLESGAEPPDRRINLKRLRNVAFLWTISVLAIGGVATWFLDSVLAVEIVSAVTAIVIVTTFARRGQWFEGGSAG